MALDAMHSDNRLFPGKPTGDLWKSKFCEKSRPAAGRPPARYSDGSQVRIAAQDIGGRLPVSKETTKKTRKRTKRTCAIQAEVPAIPAKPKIPAMMAITRNIKAHERTIGYSPFISYLDGPDRKTHVLHNTIYFNCLAKR